MKSRLAMLVMSIGLVFQVQAQIITEGGVTYFMFRGDSCPPYALEYIGNNTFQVQQTFGDVCTPVFPPPQSDYLFVLGDLEPGDYSIISAPFGFPSTAINFEIPAEQGEETLANFQRGPEGTVSFRVAGVSPTVYIVERSTDLNGWTKVGQVTGEADFSLQETENAGAAFYRVRIVQGPSTPVESAAAAE